MKPWQKKAEPSVSFGHLPIPILPAKKVPCPMCGKVGELTGKRNVEDEPILKCKYCGILYSQHLKKGFCSWNANEKNGHRLMNKKTGEMVLVRTVSPSECRNCRMHQSRTVPCPFFQGRVGAELAPPDDWEKV